MIGALRVNYFQSGQKQLILLRVHPIGSVKHCKRGAILDLGCRSFRPSFCHNFFSAQYLENNLIEFHRIAVVI